MFQQDENQVERNKKEKVGLSERFMIAMFSPREYGKLLDLSIGKLISFLVCVFLLVSVIQYAIPISGAIAGMGGLRNIILQKIPDFELKDGQFTYDDRLEIDSEELGAYVLIDTSLESISESDIEAHHDVVQEYLVSKTNMIITNFVGGKEGLRQEYKFSDLGSMHLNNEILAQYTPMFYGMMLVGFVMSYFGVVIRYLASALAYAAFIYFMTKMLPQPEVSFGRIYTVALYAKTIGAVVAAITICVGGEVLVLAGDTFAVFVTMFIMNKVCLRRVMQV
ncbi:MAG: DUF1189 family protein [Eubacteriales bacterium]|nr:DUF1189 family protein [Eubacteriales bacterium]